MKVLLKMMALLLIFGFGELSKVNSEVDQSGRPRGCTTTVIQGWYPSDSSQCRSYPSQPMALARERTN